MINLKENKKATWKEKRNRASQQKTNSKMADLNPAISTITLIIKGLNIPIKGQNCQNRYKAKQDPTISCLQVMHFKNKYNNKESKKMEKDIP